MPLSGNATTAEGLPADFVRIFRWPTGELVGVALPDENGDWSHGAPMTGDYGLTYIAAGCQPITHGPYYIESSLWTPAEISTELWLDANDTTAFLENESGAISVWKDKSGKGRDGQQATEADKPLRGGFINGVPALDFYGKHVDLPALPAGNYTHFFVVNSAA